MINFKKEISVVISRYKEKSVSFDAFENLHKHQILQKSHAPANISPKLNNQAKEIAKKINCSINTVNVHKFNMKMKLNIKSNAELFRYCASLANQ